MVHLGVVLEDPAAYQGVLGVPVYLFGRMAVVVVFCRVLTLFDCECEVLCHHVAILIIKLDTRIILDVWA